MNKFIKKHLKTLDKKAVLIFNILNYISEIICIIACFTLFLYNKFYISKYLLKTSILTFRAGIIMFSFSFVCLIFFSKLKE